MLRLLQISLLLTSTSAIRLAPLHTRMCRTAVVRLCDAEPEVKVTIRTPARAEEPAEPDVSPVCVMQFEQVKKSAAMFINLWMMGGCGGSDGWRGLGDGVAEHAPTGTRASVQIDVDQATIALMSTYTPAAEGSAHLGEFTTALLDEVEGLAKNEEVPEPDRLCYPSSAVDGVRLATWAYCAPRV